MNAYSYGVAAVALTWVPHGRWTSTLFLMWAPVGLSVGIGLGGILADRLGRRLMLRWGPVGYVIGSASLLLSSGMAPALLGSGFLMLTAGLESNTILTYSQELIPGPSKRQTMYAELNFVNMGALALAALAFVSHQWGTGLLRPGMTVLPLGLALLSLWLRRSLPESVLWEKSTDGAADLSMPPDYRLRLLVAGIFSFANTAGFSLLTYAFGTEFLPRHFHHLLLVSTATAFLVGLVARWLGQLPAATILLVGYGLAFMAALALAFVQSPGHPAFWPILFALSAFTSMSYLAEDTFKTDAWPSRVRARLISVVRVAGLLGYAAVLLAARHTPLQPFLMLIATVWGVGLLAAVVWWLADQRQGLKHQRRIATRRIREHFRRSKIR